MNTQTKPMTRAHAEHIAKLVWSGLMEQANIGPHGMPYALRSALKSETSKSGGGLPINLAKVRLVESAISGADRPTRNLGDLHGIRDGHITALMIGARLANTEAGKGAMKDLDSDDLASAAEVLFKTWQRTIQQ